MRKTKITFCQKFHTLYFPSGMKHSEASWEKGQFAPLRQFPRGKNLHGSFFIPILICAKSGQFLNKNDKSPQNAEIQTSSF